ncbi:hypothetical protein [Oceanithermus sp.]
MLGEGILDKPAIADNSTLVNFVDAGLAELLFNILGGPVYVAPSVADPGELPPFHSQPRAEANRFLFFNAEKSDCVERYERRLGFIKSHGVLWQQLQLSSRLYDKVLAYRNRFPKLKRRDGDVESLLLAEAHGLVLLCDDSALCDAAHSLGIYVYRTCGLLLFAVKAGLLTCEDAAIFYNEIMVKKNRFFSRMRIRVGATCKCV